MSESRSRRFLSNVSASLLGQGVVAVLGFLLTPILIRSLGLEAYGVYVILQAATSYLLLASLGAGGATLKFAAEHAVAGGRGFNQTLRYSTAIHAGGALLAGAALAAAAPFVAKTVFRVPPELLAPAVFALRCAAAAAVFVALTQAATSVIHGLQRFRAHSALAVLQGGLMTAGAAVLASRGYGIKGVARWYALWSAVIAVVAAAVAWRLSRAARERPGGRDLSRRDFMGYSLSLWGGSMAWIVTFQLDKVVIAQATSLSALTLYAVPAGLLQRLQTLPAVVSAVLVPMFAEIEGGGDSDETLRRMYLKSARFLLLAVLPPLALLFALMPQFLGLWLGGTFSESSVWPARLLVLAQACALFNFAPNSVAVGRGRPWYVSAVAWGQAAVSLAAWSLFVRPLGLLGVALGSLAAQALPSLLYLVGVHRLLRLDWERFFVETLLRPAASTALLLAVVFPLHALAGSWPRMITLGMAGLAVFYGSAFMLLTREDRDIVRNLRRRL